MAETFHPELSDMRVHRVFLDVGQRGNKTEKRASSGAGASRKGKGNAASLAFTPDRCRHHVFN